MDSNELSTFEDRFTLDDVMSKAFEDLKSSFWKLLGMAALAVLVVTLPQLANFALKWLTENNAFTAALVALLGVASGVLGLLMQMGLYKIQLNIVHGLPYNSNTLWEPAGKFWAFLGASICYGIMLFWGFIFFVVPGIILMITFQFYPFFIIDQNKGPIEALKESARITNGSKWELFFLSLIMMVVAGLGQMLLFIGVVPAEFFNKLTLTRAYTDLLARNPGGTSTGAENMAEKTGLIE